MSQLIIQSESWKCCGVESSLPHVSSHLPLARGVAVGVPYLALQPASLFSPALYKAAMLPRLNLTHLSSITHCDRSIFKQTHSLLFKQISSEFLLQKMAAHNQNPTNTLPSNFLSSPARDLIVQRIDFSTTPLPEYKGLYATVIDNVLSEAECAALVRAAEAHTDGKWEQALINVGGGRQALISDQRDCGRIIWDDRDVVARIWARIAPSVPELESLANAGGITGKGPVKRKEAYQMTRLNERMRFLKYRAGQYFRCKHSPSFWILLPLHQQLPPSLLLDHSPPPFAPPLFFFALPIPPILPHPQSLKPQSLKTNLQKPKIAHQDGSYITPDGQERSFYTLHLYLNDSSGTPRVPQDTTSQNDSVSDEAPLQGGATTFHSLNMKREWDVEPKVGRVLLFQHRKLVHSGADVIKGIKLTMRTDLMYKVVGGEKS